MDSAHQFAEEWTPRLDAVLMGDSFVNLLAEAFSVYAADRTAALRADNKRLLTALEDLINASDGCRGHRDCNHTMEPWQRARTLLANSEGQRVGEEWRDARALVEEQAKDPGLWFIAQTAPEGYLQQELRRLHAAVERTRQP